ncbi:hypothetical protein [Clostridium uliginosum]|uniref:Uncharacterized protein n=1 Tax=Clostridium uliginosum TaxID=119641 RepID=A0A1I1I4L7_9CLOT|nr:hypothetical protein [Clostridium uliginosum]SFC28633.1 hypothetical protein SAMN05421842_10246 [Clostridium uliginosum]
MYQLKKENDKFDHIVNNIKIKKCGNKTEYFINKETRETCLFLDKQGLCQILKSHGEEDLLVRYAVFLKYCMNKNKEIGTEDIKDYIVFF